MASTHRTNVTWGPGLPARREPREQAYRQTGGERTNPAYTGSVPRESAIIPAGSDARLTEGQISRENYAPYDLLRNPFEEEGRNAIGATLSQVPLGGFVREGAERLGMNPRHALWAERVAAATTAGVGAGTFFAAVQALNDNTQTPGTIPIQ